MRGKVFLVFAVAVVAFHTIPSHGANEEIEEEQKQPIPDVTPEDLQAIAAHLKFLTSSDAFKSVVGQVGSGDLVLDISFMEKTLQALGGLVTGANPTDLLSNVNQLPSEVLEGLFGEEGEEGDEEVLDTILMYLRSMKKVLHGNGYLRGQVTDLIRLNAEKLLANGNLTEVLKEISQSQVFADLKDEVEEDIENKGIIVPTPDTGDEMSR